MSCKSALNNSVKSNSEASQWPKQSSTETNVKLAGEEAKDRLYEPKHKKKLVRVLTVVAYIFSVSLAAIMLSLYYIFIWNPYSKAKLLSDGGNAAKSMYNCHDLRNQEALAQIKVEDSLDVTSSPNNDEINSVISSWQTTTEDSIEHFYDEASSETKIDDDGDNMIRNIENSILSYENSDDHIISNETAYK